LSYTSARECSLSFNITPDRYQSYLAFIERRLAEWYGSQLIRVERMIINDMPAIRAEVGFGDDCFIRLTLIADVNPRVLVECTSRASIEDVLDVMVNLQYFTYQFISRVGEGMLGLVFIPGLPITPIRQLSVAKRILNQVFSGNLLTLYIIFLFIGLAFFAFMGRYAPIGIVFFQFILLLLSPRILSLIGDWQLSPKCGELYIAICKMPISDFKLLVLKKWSDVVKIKSQISKLTFESGRPLTPEVVSEVMGKWGINCPPNRISIKVVPIYRIVEEVARAYNVSPPKTIIANTLIPNAAITGPSLKNSILLVTSGLALSLNSDEIRAVIGHEFSHAVHRDPLILFAFSSMEYLTRVYVLWMLRWPLDLIYFVLSVTALYFIAKFLEARADLESAFRLRSSRALSSALVKIGFHRMFYERFKSYRIQRWIGWDPHPPVYFRVLRLEKLDLRFKPKSFLLQSARECIRGFISALMA